jgi:hypothetical protein
MRKFLITEEDRKHILGLYGLIREAIDPNSGGTVTLINKYESGYYTTSAVDKSDTLGKTIKDKLDAELVKVTEFVKKYPNSIVSVKFTSRESSLPNTDNEKTGYFKKHRLDVGELSKAREYYLNQYIQSYFQSLKDQGVIQSSVQVPPVEFVPQDPSKKFISSNKNETPWCIKGDPQIPANDTQGYACTGKDYKVNGDVKNNWFNQKNGIYASELKAFKDEQSSSIEITVKIAQPATSATTTLKPLVTTTTTIPKPDCAAGLKVRIYVPTHRCQNAEFFLFANKTLLYNSAGGYTANLNNSDASRGVPTYGSLPSIPAWLLNPGYGDLKNGDGTFNYGYGKSKPGGDLEGGRSDTFTITAEQSAQIVKDGKIEFYFICTTDDAHDDIPQIEVLKNGKSLIDEKTKKEVENPLDVNSIKGRLFTTDACGTTLIRNTTKLGKSDEASYAGLRAQYIQQLVAEREKIMNNSGIANKIQRIFKKEPDSKGLELSRAQSLINEMLDLVKKIIAKDQMYIGKDVAITDANLQAVYTKLYNIIKPSEGVSFERSGGIGSGGPYTYSDKTINSDKLYGDIRRRLEEFYKAFDAVFYDDNTEKITPTGIPKRATISANMRTDLPGSWDEYLTMGT